MVKPVCAALVLGLLILVVFATESTHSNNWAVIISTSKYFFNYRHNSNALTIYKMVKELGIPDSQILLMLPEDVACNPRNPFPATVFNNPAHTENLYAADNISVDYKGDDVTVEAFLRLLSGRHEPYVPLSQRLRSDENSNVFIYMSGHGGDGFIKFRDAEVLSSEDVAGALRDMYAQRRYRHLFFLLDTCQAATLLETVDSPGVIAISASARGENSFSHGSDPTVGVSLVDKMTNGLVKYYQNTRAQTSFTDMLSYLSYRDMGAHTTVHTTPGAPPLDSTPVAAFWGGANPYYPVRPRMEPLPRVTVPRQPVPSDSTGGGVDMGVDDDVDAAVGERGIEWPSNIVTALPSTTRSPPSSCTSPSPVYSATNTTVNAGSSAFGSTRMGKMGKMGKTANASIAMSAGGAQVNATRSILEWLEILEYEGEGEIVFEPLYDTAEEEAMWPVSPGDDGGAAGGEGNSDAGSGGVWRKCGLLAVVCLAVALVMREACGHDGDASGNGSGGSLGRDRSCSASSCGADNRASSSGDKSGGAGNGSGGGDSVDGAGAGDDEEDSCRVVRRRPVSGINGS